MFVVVFVWGVGGGGDYWFGLFDLDCWLGGGVF